MKFNQLFPDVKGTYWNQEISAIEIIEEGPALNSGIHDPLCNSFHIYGGNQIHLGYVDVPFCAAGIISETEL